MTSVEQRGCPVLSEIRGLAVVLGFEHRAPAADSTCSPLFRLKSALRARAALARETFLRKVRLS